VIKPELSYFGFGKQVTIRLVKIVFNTFSSPFSIFSENEDRKQPNQTPPKYLKAFKFQKQLLEDPLKITIVRHFRKLSLYNFYYL